MGCFKSYYKLGLPLNIDAVCVIYMILKKIWSVQMPVWCFKKKLNTNKVKYKSSEVLGMSGLMNKCQGQLINICQGQIISPLLLCHSLPGLSQNIYIFAFRVNFTIIYSSIIKCKLRGL